MARRRPAPARSRVRPHRFVYAPELADRLGRRWCGRCGLPGRPGDHRHPVDEQLLADAAAVDRRIVGGW